MKRSLLLAALLLAGCANTQLAPTIEPAFVQILKRHGLTPDSTRKIDLVASEGGYGSGLQVIITEEFLIQEIWDTIYQSRPYRARVASGSRGGAFAFCAHRHRCRSGIRWRRGRIGRGLRRRFGARAF